MQFLVRTATPPLSMVEEIRAAVRSVDPTLAVAQVQTMEQVVADDGAERAFTMVLPTYCSRLGGPPSKRNRTSRPSGSSATMK